MTVQPILSSEFVDRENLFDLVRKERFARDQRRFDVMAECFHKNAWVRTTWYDGLGGQAYVDASRDKMGPTDFSKHWVFPAFARINGDRATVESPAKIFNRIEIGGIEADFHAYTRFYSRAVRENGQWKLLTFHVFFEKDELRPVFAGQAPKLDEKILAKVRPSYRFLGYYQITKGVNLNMNLLGDDRWDELVAFHKREDEWLAGKGAIDDPK
jgi:hypothetical protein